VHSAYRDDRDAALAAAETLRRENDELQRENRYLRNLLDPDGVGGSRAQAIAQLQGALGVTTLLLGALAGAAFVAHQLPGDGGCTSASAPTPREVSLAVLRGGDPVDGIDRAGLGVGRPLQHLVPFEVLDAGPQATAAAKRDDAAAVTTRRLRVAYAAVLPAVARCVAGPRARVLVTVSYDQSGAVAEAEVEPRRGVVGFEAQACVRAASLGATLGSQRAPSVTARYTVDVRHGTARLRRVSW